ncbi:hypothetical protein QA596_06870 [Balneolales bacterium ANBcel1]|nr:hypothetical protein [Balneolales bacterium ANBcel1]
MIAVLLLLLTFFSSCEQPSSPDFEMQQSVEIPIIQSITYRILGEGSGAIIDTTSEDYEELFIVDEAGLIYLTTEADFDMGDFDSVLPEVDVTPTEVDAEIGTLVIRGIERDQVVDEAIEPQDFFSSGDIEITDEDLKFITEEHYIEIESGEMHIGNFINNIDLDIDTLVISFPGIVMDTDGSGTYNPSDTLWVQFVGDERIRRSERAHLGQPEKWISLENARIFAQDNIVRYNLAAITEDTRLHPADSSRTVSATDNISASVDISELDIRVSFGEIQRSVEILNDDVTGDGNVDLFNDEEADISDLDDFSALSERISGIYLTNPVLDLLYDSNIGVEGTVIAAIVGINSRGERVYLTGLPGTERYVDPLSPDLGNLVADGEPIPAENLVQFDIEPVPFENMWEVIYDRYVRFDTDNSNVAEFMSNLPTEVRFVGKLVVNPEYAEGFVVDPVDLATRMAIDIPINLATDDGPAQIEDTLSADLSGLPSPDDDIQISEMTMHVRYENGQPFTTEFKLQFLDENDQIIDMDPVAFELEGAQVDPASRVVSHPRGGSTEVRFTGHHLDHLYRARRVNLLGDMLTTEVSNSSEVRLRADDFITLGISINLTTSIRVD